MIDRGWLTIYAYFLKRSTFVLLTSLEDERCSRKPHTTPHTTPPGLWTRTHTCIHTRIQPRTHTHTRRARQICKRMWCDVRTFNLWLKDFNLTEITYFHRTYLLAKPNNWFNDIHSNPYQSIINNIIQNVGWEENRIYVVFTSWFLIFVFFSKSEPLAFFSFSELRIETSKLSVKAIFFSLDTCKSKLNDSAVHVWVKSNFEESE